jgi:hypothetical protein
MQLIAHTNSVDPSATLGLLTAAALALVPAAAHAVVGPDAATVEINNLAYQDYDSQHNRMAVHSPVLWLQAPLGEANSVEASATLDSLAGASPLFHNALSGASGKGVQDHRYAGDVKLSHDFERASVSLGGAYSDENDYQSRAANISGQWFTADQNTSVSAGIGQSHDRISAADRPLVHGRRQTTDYLLGVTQVLTPVDIVQSNLTYSAGGGDFNDPYKVLDKRPDSREALAWLTRYRHWMTGLDAAIHLDYRYYRDTWDVHAHSLEASWYQPVDEHWIVRPSLRYYTQDAARFFSNQFPPRHFGDIYSADARLGAFGAVTVGLKLSRQFDPDTRIDLLAERYEQRTGLHWGGNGSPALAPLQARWLSVGLVHTFR